MNGAHSADFGESPRRHEPRRAATQSLRALFRWAFPPVLFGLLLVFAALGVLSAVLVTPERGLRKANVPTTRAHMILLEAGVEEFATSHRRLPAALDDLISDDVDLLESDEVPTDAWGNDFLYFPLGQRGFILMSLGADGVVGGTGEDADIDRKAAHRTDD